MCKHQKSLGYLGLCCSQWGDNLTAHSKCLYSAHKLSNKTSTTPLLWVWVGMLLQRTMEGYAGSYVGRCQRTIMYRFILQNPQNHFANPHENHYLMELARYRLLCPISLPVWQFEQFRIAQISQRYLPRRSGLYRAYSIVHSLQTDHCTFPPSTQLVIVLLSFLQSSNYSP